MYYNGDSYLYFRVSDVLEQLSSACQNFFKWTKIFCCNKSYFVANARFVTIYRYFVANFCCLYIFLFFCVLLYQLCKYTPDKGHFALIESLTTFDTLIWLDRVPIWLGKSHFQQQVGWGTRLDIIQRQPFRKMISIDTLPSPPKISINSKPARMPLMHSMTSVLPCVVAMKTLPKALLRLMCWLHILHILHFYIFCIFFQFIYSTDFAYYTYFTHYAYFSHSAYFAYSAHSV